MYYWLDGLINSNLLEPGFLDIVRVVGFLLGLLLGYILLARGPRRFSWLLIVFMGAVCTKGLILVFEYLGFYSAHLLQASPYFISFTLIFLALVTGLIFLAVKNNKRHYKRRW